MELLGSLGVYIFGFLLNAAPTPLIMGMWAVLFMRFGLLPPLLARSKRTADEKKHVTKSLTRVTLGLGLLGTLLTFPLCYNIEWIGESRHLLEETVGNRIANVIASVLFGEVRIAIIVEEWLALIGFFGLRHMSNRFRLSIGQRQKISWYFAVTILVVGMVTVLAGLVWSINAYTEPVDWDRLEETGFIVGMALGPFTGLLTIGMVVMLAISLVQAIHLEEGDGQREHLARSLTLALLSTFILLSVIGGLWSALIYSLWMQGRLWM